MINPDSIRHIELSDDIHNDNMVYGDSSYDNFTPNGRVNVSPETWEIYNDSTAQAYLYDNKEDYEHDCRELGFLEYMTDIDLFNILINLHIIDPMEAFEDWRGEKELMLHMIDNDKSLRN